MQTEYILCAMAVSAVITFMLRALPFAIFRGGRHMPDSIVKLGQVLPATIMAVLIVYCIKDAFGEWIGIGIPKVFGILTVGISYKWKHNTFISIAAGTVVYMLMLRLC